MGGSHLVRQLVDMLRFLLDAGYRYESLGLDGDAGVNSRRFCACFVVRDDVDYFRLAVQTVLGGHGAHGSVDTCGSARVRRGAWRVGQLSPVAGRTWRGFAV